MNPIDTLVVGEMAIKRRGNGQGPATLTIVLSHEQAATAASRPRTFTLFGAAGAPVLIPFYEGVMFDNGTVAARALLLGEGDDGRSIHTWDTLDALLEETNCTVVWHGGSNVPA